MKKNPGQAIQVSVIALFFIIFSSFISPLNSMGLFNSRVYAGSVQDNSNIFAQSDNISQSNPSIVSNTMFIKQQVPVYSNPVNNMTIIGFVENQTIRVLTKENNWCHIEYNSINGVSRGYIDQKYVSPDLQIPIADYSRSKQIVWLDKHTTIYSGPSEKYVSVQKLGDQAVTVLNKEDGWYFIEYSFSRTTKRGYVNSKSIIIGSSPYTQPMPKDPPSLDQRIKTLLDITRLEIGSIGTGEKGNTTKYGQWYGLDDIPWCSSFISWAAAHSNLQDVIPRTASYLDSLNWFQSRNLWGDIPKIGALVYFDDNNTDYVGIVESMNNDDTITVIVGDYAIDNIYQVARINLKTKSSSIAGYGYPQYSLSGLGYYQLNGDTLVYCGPSDEYAQIGPIENEIVKVLNREGNRIFIEYNLTGIKKRGYINPSYVSMISEPSIIDYTGSTKLGLVTGFTTVYDGPSTDYSTEGFLENEQVTILTTEGNWHYIEFVTPTGKKRGYVLSDYIKEVIAPSVTSSASSTSSDTSGTIDIGKYVYKFTNALITSYSDRGAGAAGEDYYCDGSGKIVAAHNMRAGTKIYIPDLKYVNSTGIFIVGDTGGPFFDFDINTRANVDRSAHDVYVLSWGDGPMMQSFEVAKQQQMNYGHWNRSKSMYENFKGQFQTENFTQP